MFKVGIDTEGKRLILSLREQHAEGPKAQQVTIDGTRTEMRTLGVLLQTAASADDADTCEVTLDSLKVAS